MNLILEKKVRYDMKTISGGFSDGVQIKAGQSPGTVILSINIYGGGKNIGHTLKVPPKIAELQASYVAAVNSGDPVSEELKMKINVYYNTVKKAISIQIARMMQSLDDEFGKRMTATIEKINSKYV